jgi:hypothetical protein
MVSRQEARIIFVSIYLVYTIIAALLHNSIYLDRGLVYSTSMIHWPSYNQSLVRRGEILFSHDFLDVWDDNLDRM